MENAGPQRGLFRKWGCMTIEIDIRNDGKTFFDTQFWEIWKTRTREVYTDWFFRLARHS